MNKKGLKLTKVVKLNKSKVNKKGIRNIKGAKKGNNKHKPKQSTKNSRNSLTKPQNIGKNSLKVTKKGI